MKLKFLSQSTLDDLKVNNHAYAKYYYRKDNQWMDEYLNEEGKVLESKISFEMPNFNFDPNYNISDPANVKIVHNALMHLKETEATDERLWTGLAHIQFRDYMNYRFQEYYDKKEEKKLKSHLFYTYNPKRSVFLHVIGRLWWIAHITYDETNKENPYWLTDFLTKNAFASNCLLFSSSNVVNNRNISIGILRALKKFDESYFRIGRNQLVEAFRFLNVVGGAMVLDMLSTKEVEEMVFDRLEKEFVDEKKVAQFT